MTEFLQALIRGLGQGSIYVLVALGLVIIYKATKVISFAQPALMVVGGTATALLAVEAGVPFFLALLLAMALTGGVGVTVERLALRPMVGKPVFTLAIITLGVDIFLRVIVNRLLGAQVRPVGDPWGLSTWSLGGLFVQQRYVAMFVTTAAAVALLGLFFRYSRSGLAMRAAAFDQETALAQGVDVGRVFALSWLIAGVLGALAGTFAGTTAGLDQTTWVIALKALPAIILGGLDSLSGAVVGGLAVGVFESLVAAYQPDLAPWLGNNFALVSPYFLLLIVLLIRPYGLFGTPEVERV